MVVGGAVCLPYEYTRYAFRKGYAMGAREDDERAYTTYDDIVGRSMRRGTRKALSALTLGIFSDDPARGSLEALARDAAKELPTAIERSRRNGD